MIVSRSELKSTACVDCARCFSTVVDFIRAPNAVWCLSTERHTDTSPNIFVYTLTLRDAIIINLDGLYKGMQKSNISRFLSICCSNRYLRVLL